MHEIKATDWQRMNTWEQSDYVERHGGEVLIMYHGKPAYVAMSETMLKDGRIDYVLEEKDDATE